MLELLKAPSPTTQMHFETLLSMSELAGYWKWSNELLQKLGLDVNTTNSKLAGQHMALSGQLNGGVWKDTTWKDVVATAIVLW
ncbi:unnamed protein product [Penicillium pancosmium]